ncbi:hypothetical protein N7481_003135 [Penicillium waksmanii]|uniref:uncharacterized protein n=1 Tax=Penicillium waksmanii TaxID=69791 RepID=UPI0025484968|nr:uncharacterized protein N7481_003135 [Penicillium waksmanii]KAJ5987925.1 hypothetical protein N7481_003135 [Penicillium waksmanii]
MPLGRRNCIIIGNILITIGGVIQAASYSVPQIIVARVLCSEMSIEARERGPEVAINCSALLLGVALSYWVSFGFTRMTNQISWRLPIAMQSIFSILSGTSMFFLPDTPRWYYMRDRIEEGDKTLSRLYGVYRKGMPSYGDIPEIQDMKSTILVSLRVEEESENKLTFLSIIWDNTPLRVGRRIRISFIILGIQQSMGINIMVYYMTRIFSEVGLSSFMASLIAALALTVQWMGSWVCIPTIERIGRRRIMMLTGSVQTFCLLIFVVLNMIENKTDATRWAAAMILFPYLFFYGWGWVGCPWLYGPEIAPLRYRHIGSAAGLLGVWVFTFITVFAGGIALKTVGARIWIWPLIFNVIAVIFVYFMCPDPTGKTLEEIDQLFAKDGALLDRLSQSDTEKECVHEVENSA